MMLNEVIDYLVDTYGDAGANRLSGTKMVAHMAMSKSLPEDWKSLIDKVALFNGIKKVAA